MGEVWSLGRNLQRHGKKQWENNDENPLDIEVVAGKHEHDEIKMGIKGEYGLQWVNHWWNSGLKNGQWDIQFETTLPHK